MKKVLVACSLAAIVGLMMPAQAAVNVIATPPGGTAVGFATPTVYLSQAAPAMFLQLDPTAPHDVFECPASCSGTYQSTQSKFYTDRGRTPGAYAIPFRGTVTPGTYRFICAVHPNMVGTA